MQELPSLVDRLIFSNAWGFRNLEYRYDFLLESEQKVKILMQFENQFLRQKEDCFGKLNLKVNNNVFYSGPFTFLPRGRHRPIIPMGGISFKKNGIINRYHIIIKEDHKIDEVQYKEFSDFSMSDIFWSEVFSYNLLFSISTVYLQCNIVEIEISSKGSNISTMALLVEDFSSNNGEKEFNNSQDESKFFEPRDLTNFELFELSLRKQSFLFRLY